jgi:amidase
VVDDLKIDYINEIINGQSEAIALNFEFKLSLNAYLKDLIAAPVKSLADVISFNNKHQKLVSIYVILFN